MRLTPPTLVLLAGCGLFSGTPTDDSAKTTPPEAQTPVDPTINAPSTENTDWAKAPPDVSAPPATAQKTASGLAYVILEAAPGAAHPSASATVKVDYTGWTTDGQMFDSSRKHGGPASFPLNRVIAGWTEGLQLLGKGERARLWIPQDLAYKGQEGPPKGMLVFDITLHDFTEPPAAPADVAAPPADATTTASGLAYKILEHGSGTEHPTATSKVTVHYSGWLTSGEMFDSSVQRGSPATFPLNRVIAGWTEGLQLMSVGDKARFWIPQDLAYKGQAGAPPGMLVFDVELLSIAN